MIYIHVPFCEQKCPYCDFYSIPQRDLEQEYVEAVAREIRKYQRDNITAKTLYFGGGTPSLLEIESFRTLIDVVRESFSLTESAELTVEANPGTVTRDYIKALAELGINRLSLGLQSANQEELRQLGRRHSTKDVENVVEWAREAGIENISVDLMLCLPSSSTEKLKKSIDFAVSLGVQHISSYMLKLEENTEFYRRRQELVLPDEDEAAQQYFFMVEELEKHGFGQYEISNFARAGYESQHNLIYWHDEEYLGFGPSAHSFYKGKRFFYDRDLQGFIENAQQVQDGEGGSFEEYVMLALRLSEGVCKMRCEERYSGEEYENLLQNAKKIPHSLIRADEKNISLTKEGFLLSNAIIAQLLD